MNLTENCSSFNQSDNSSAISFSNCDWLKDEQQFFCQIRIEFEFLIALIGKIMGKYGLLCLLTLFVIYQIEAKSGIIEIAEDLENEIFHIDHYNKELFNMIQPSVHPSKKPGYCKYCKFCKYW